ncbi:reprolysin-like metallopeptidase [Hymenobacter sp. GOD-10R]|uniref:reprolysin-like metallopeptidase n=1 Tax=Hymenobacter sp. GOD-10R TaxID=3093922 RepID=UPI002D76F4B0|nr:zinc-dependent metalloprotease family protein [Hymenobacter sp. GOD-10R]WRQ27492.1 zinc-dependent metalloprotease family protein [Hymenobacter sp. GOD-10R]
MFFTVTIRPPSCWLRLLVVSLLSTFLASPRYATAQRVFWSDGPQAPQATRVQQQHLARYRTVRFQRGVLQQLLQPASTSATQARPASTVLSLPLPDGSSVRLQVTEVQVMAPALAARYPTIKTYTARGLDDPSLTARLELTPDGFHAMLRLRDKTVYIEPTGLADPTSHLVFERAAVQQRDSWVCRTTETSATQTRQATTTNSQRLPNGNLLRTYRLALACTGEYAVAVAGANPTKSAVLGKMVSSINRVNGVYEQELSVRLVLVANTDQLIYLDRTTDPYSNLSNNATLAKNQVTTDSIIGTANYDIGHVFNTADGGIAGFGVVCRAGQKARGSTGLPNPIGDAFDIDYVAHEMGHEFGAEHTFNSVLGNCGGGNRVANSAYEPGSGSTIMAYAGICGADNLQVNSDPYFHSRSLDQITAYLTSTATCSVNALNGNLPPVVDAGSSYVIPINTPFTLTGTATDPDGDALTYSWEQFNLGLAGVPTIPLGDAPIFRVLPPTSSPARTFPRLTDLLNNATMLGEQLPTYDRRLIFRLVARDNRVTGGAINYDSMQVVVAANTGPFLVTSPSTTGATWYKGVAQPVTWDVANTTAAPINATSVRISLSTDGGLTFPTILVASTPNDGSESITLPSSISNTTTARIKVEAIGNIFFAISKQNFTIQTPTIPSFIVSSTAPTTTVCSSSAPTAITVTATPVLGFANAITLSANNLPSGVTASFATNPITPGSSTQLSLTATSAAPAGSYQLTLTATSGNTSQSQLVSFRVCAQPTAPLAPFGLTAAPNNATVELTWVDNSKDETGFEVERSVGNTTSYQRLITTAANAISYTDQLPASGIYYYRVRAINAVGPSPYSDDEIVAYMILAAHINAGAAGVSVYPNPSTGQFQVAVANAQNGPIELRVTDALGRVVHQQTLTKSAFSLLYPLDLRPLANGVYHLHLALPAGPTVLRLLKQ